MIYVGPAKLPILAPIHQDDEIQPKSISDGTQDQSRQQDNTHPPEIHHTHHHQAISTKRKAQQQNYKKHRELFEAILKIDETATILDQNDNECSTEQDIPDGKQYEQKFIINTDDRRGITFVQCKIKSKFTVYDLKYR